MISNIQGTFEKFVDWQKCAALIQKEAVTYAERDSHRLPLHNSGALPPVHEIFKRPPYIA